MLRHAPGAIVAALVSATAVSGVMPAAVRAAEGSAAILTVVTTPTLGCGVRHRDDPTLDFFGSEVHVFDGTTYQKELALDQAVCGTFVAVDGEVFGPATTLGAEAGDGPVASFTPVSQTGPTGAGTSADPFAIVTRVAAGDTGVLVEQTDVWSAADETITTTIVLTAPDGASVRRSVQVYRAADCQAASLPSFGRTAPGVAACVVVEQDGAFRDLARLVPGAGLVRFSGEGAVAVVDTGGLDRAGAESDVAQLPSFAGSLGFGDVIDASLLTGSPLVAGCTRCEPDAALDRTIAVGWTVAVDGGRPTTLTTTLTVSTGAARASARLTAEPDASSPEVVTARFDAPAPTSDSGRTLRFVRDGTEVCRVDTDATGRATCDVTLDPPDGAPIEGWAPAPVVDVLFDGDLDLRPAGALAVLGSWPAPAGPPSAACLPVPGRYSTTGTAEGRQTLVLPFVTTSCPTVRYALHTLDGFPLAYLPGDGTSSLSFEVPGPGPRGLPAELVVTPMRRPDEILTRLPIGVVSPGKPRR